MPNGYSSCQALRFDVKDNAHPRREQLLLQLKHLVEIALPERAIAQAAELLPQHVQAMHSVLFF
jgi:hypothetical protein